MQIIHQPAVADLFYPGNSEELKEWLITHIPATPKDVKKPKALILPHAGYRFSGDIAAKGYALIKPFNFSRVVILSPAHRVALEGMALPTRWDAEQTPLGIVPIDKNKINQLLDLPEVISATEAHRLEHAIEVHLPFLQHQLKDFSLIPIVVGHCQPESVEQLLDAVLDENTLLIISTDLSHYLPDNQAKKEDEITIHHIIEFHENLNPRQACGCYALNGALRWARHHNLQIELLDQCTSGDVCEEKTKVVGYASFALFE